jgi:hypothetical protein
MNCSVQIHGTQSIYFLTETPDNPDGLLEIDPGAWVEVPMNVLWWPEGARRPESVLCRSTEDPKYYKIFKYRNEIEGTEWEEAGLSFGGTFSKDSWREFAERLGSMTRAMHTVPNDDDHGGV